MIVKFFYSKSATIGVMKDTIRILHINDLHSHFEQYPQLKRAVDDLSQTDRELIKVILGTMWISPIPYLMRQLGVLM